MTRKKSKNRVAARPVDTVVTLRLYVAGNAANSVKAITNLEVICKQYLRDRYKLEIVDVCEHPSRALADGILVTPSLAKLSPAPSSSVIGDLSDTGSVLAALGLNAGAPG
jgi:circadian clock protein KaiB